jgi:cytochrome P450
MVMQELATRDYFTDHSILLDPYAYFDAVRELGPVCELPGQNMVAVTGFEEALEVLRNTEDFSSAICVQGPALQLTFEPVGSDISEQIESHRSDFHGGDSLVTLDNQPHNFSRAIISRLFTPSKLKANEAFMEGYAKELVGSVVAKGRCDLVNEVATPFVTLVIADLLGVPAEDRQLFMDVINDAPPPGSLDSHNIAPEDQPLAVMARYFIKYVLDRRQNPKDDVLSDLSNAKFPDGSTPDADEIVRLSTFLFGAGQDTSAKLITSCLRYIIDTPGLQQTLRDDISIIPDMIEEVLRLEGSSKMTSRIAKKDTHIGEMPIPAGTKVFVALAAANRDPRRFDNPHAFVLGRAKAKEHLAFGRGAHVCAGSPLARTEVRVLLEQFLTQTSDIDFDEAVHGPRGSRQLDYEPSFIVRGLSQMRLKFKAGVVRSNEPALTERV